MTTWPPDPQPIPAGSYPGDDGLDGVRLAADRAYAAAAALDARLKAERGLAPQTPSAGPGDAETQAQAGDAAAEQKGA